MKVILLVILHLVVGKLYCSGDAQIQFIRYEDHYNCGESNDCDFYFKPLKILDGDNNILYQIARTDDRLNSNNIDLTTIEQLEDSIDIELPTNKTVKIFISVWDDDNINADDFVRKWTHPVVPFKYIAAGWSWVTKRYYKYHDQESTSKLEIRYRIIRCDDYFTGKGCNFCEDNRYTETCNIYCKEVVGNYTCDPATGQKLCEENHYTETCNIYCKAVVGNYTCDSTTGQKLCVQVNHYTETCNIYCKAVVGNYTCDPTTGQKICEANHYTETCNIYCKAVVGNYTCDPTTGQKICEENHYTETCNIYCKAVVGNYTCDPATGQKICTSTSRKTGANCDECQNLQKIGQDCDTCKVGWAGDNCETCAENYYPDGQCTVFCQQDPEKYTCSDSGDKVCQGNWNGTNCDTCSNHYYGEICSKYCKDTGDYNCTDTGDVVFLKMEETATDKRYGLWIASAVAVIFFVTTILCVMYIIYLRRTVSNSTSNTPHVLLTPQYVKTTTTANTYIYTDKMMNEVTAEADALYDYVRPADVMRHKCREPIEPIYHNHDC